MTELSFSEWRRLKEEKSYLGGIRGSLSGWHIRDIYSTSKSVRLAAIWVSLEFMRHPRQKYMLTKEQRIYSVQSQDTGWEMTWRKKRQFRGEAWNNRGQRWGQTSEGKREGTNMGEPQIFEEKRPPPQNPRYTRQNTWLLIRATVVFRCVY